MVEKKYSPTIIDFSEGILIGEIFKPEVLRENIYLLQQILEITKTDNIVDAYAVYLSTMSLIEKKIYDNKRNGNGGVKI